MIADYPTAVARTRETRQAGALTLLHRTASQHAQALAASFGAEDMLLIDLIARHRRTASGAARVGQPLDNRATGSFMLIDEVTNVTVAAGLIQ